MDGTMKDFSKILQPRQIRSIKANSNNFVISHLQLARILKKSLSLHAIGRSCISIDFFEINEWKEC